MVRRYAYSFVVALMLAAYVLIFTFYADDSLPSVLLQLPGRLCLAFAPRMVRETDNIAFVKAYIFLLSAIPEGFLLSWPVFILWNKRLDPPSQPSDSGKD